MKNVPKEKEKEKRGLTFLSRAGMWCVAARPKTLSMGLMPVVIAASIVWRYSPRAGAGLVRYWMLVALCLMVSLCLQIAVNYANDYSDGIRGTDAERGFGDDLADGDSSVASSADLQKKAAPARLTASKEVKSSSVLLAAGIFALIAVSAGLIVIFQTSNFGLLFVGALCLVGGWFYTGGRRPYGYAGLGEAAVFLFFGIIAVGGTVYVLDTEISYVPVMIAGIVTSGCYACVLMLINNLRDVESDATAGKRTLVVLVGRNWGLAIQAVFSLCGFAATVYAVLAMGTAAGVSIGARWGVIGVILLGLAIHSALIVWNGKRGNFRKAFNLAGPAALIASLSYVLVSVLG